MKCDSCALLAACFLNVATGIQSSANGESAVPLAKGDSTIMEKIFELEDSAMEEWRKGNPMRWIEISSDDVIYMDPALDAPIVGKEAYIDYLAPLKGQIFYDKSEYVNPKVALYGKTAVLTYNYHSLRKSSTGQLQRTSFWNTSGSLAVSNGSNPNSLINLP